MKRRDFLAGSAVAAVMACTHAAGAAEIFPITKTDEEWKKILSPTQYHILREEGTEAPFTSALVQEHREGVFACAGCDTPLFESKTKYESGTGWPSFYDSIAGRVATKTDSSLFMTRTEFHCAKCGGHHGHVFDDGPKPTGLRYCSNGAVLKFAAKAG